MGYRAVSSRPENHACRRGKQVWRAFVKLGHSTPAFVTWGAWKGGDSLPFPRLEFIPLFPFFLQHLSFVRGIYHDSLIRRPLEPAAVSHHGDGDRQVTLGNLHLPP